MEIGQSIYKIRNNAKLTQDQFAEIFDVSQQAVQKWESGSAVPDIEKIVKIAKYFDVSLDSLVMGNDNRLVEDMNKSEILKPQYKNIHDSIPQDIKAQIIMGIKNRMYGEGMILETLTFNEWIKQVEAIV